MYSIVILIYIIIASIKWAAWRNWEDYYSTILYYIIADLIYDLSFNNKALWIFENHLYSDAFVTFIVFPCIIILFLTYLPPSLFKSIIYILLSAAIATLIEFISLKTGSITYYYGWNILSSFIFLFVMFILLSLHYKKPLLSWPISIGVGYVMLYLFDIRISSIKYW